MRFDSLILILLSSTNHFSTEYFVSTLGDNSNNGSINSPWATVQYGVDQLSAGDILSIRA